MTTILPLPPTAQTPSFERFASDRQLQSFLVNAALKQYDSLFGQTTYPYWPVYRGGPVVMTAQASPSLALNDSATSSREFSQTNTQEQGVDEADLVETDGEFIYQVDGQTLTIVDARNASQLSITDQLDLADLGNIQGAYLYNDQLTIISTGSYIQPYARTTVSRSETSLAVSSRIASPAIWPYPSYEPTVNVSVFDVSNPYRIRLQEQSKLDGNLISSRAVNDKVYVVTQDNFGLPAPELIPVWSKEPRIDVLASNVLEARLLEASGGVGDRTASLSRILPYPYPTPYPQPSYRYETKAAYLKRIQGQELELALPGFTTTNQWGQTVRSGLLNQSQDIYKPSDHQPANLATVSVFDVDDNHLGPDESVGLPTAYLSNVYMSQDNLYLVRNDWWNGGKTGILKLDLDSLDFVAWGEVSGRALNQFSLDEEQGFLRIATTEGFGTQSTNNLFILQQQGQSLKTVGQINDIAPGETIRSARFQDDYGFMVTFRQVDPFFSFDLSEPTQPKLAGELKLPGFSQYLQVIENEGRSQVLGVGQDADETTGRVRGLKLSLFDVEDLNHPLEVDSYLFEGKYSSSEAQWDQQAVSYFPQFDTLAIPFQNAVGGQGLRVFDVDAQDGFRVIGDITHEGAQIRRSLTIGDDLYAISSQRITVHDIKTLALVDEVVWSGEHYPKMGPMPLPIVRSLSVAETSSVGFGAVASSSANLLAVV